MDEPLASAPRVVAEPPEAHPPDEAVQIAGLVFPYFLVDPYGRIARLNHAAENLLGTSAKRVRGQLFGALIKPQDPRVYRRIEAGDAAMVARDAAIDVLGKRITATLTLSPINAHAGWRAATLSASGYDEIAMGADEGGAIGAPAILAHEIKNPLSAIRGAAQLIARKLPHSQKSLARMITDEVDRIARLIDRMQQLGSEQAGPLAPCNPHQAIRSAIATLQAAPGSASCAIEEEFDPSLPQVLANQDALEQVLLNLLANARDAALAGAHKADLPPSITVRTRYASGLVFSAKTTERSVRLPIEITISDNGAGVDPALREHLFEPFVSSKQSGQGLGLALVRKLLRDMDGNISHERDDLSGLTHFRIHLPLARG